MASEESTETADALEAVLTAFKAGSIDGDEAARQIRGHFFTDLGHDNQHFGTAQLVQPRDQPGWPSDADIVNTLHVVALELSG